MALIFIVSAQPKDEGMIPDFGILDYPVKKAAHLTEYAILAGLTLRGLRGEKPARARHYAAAFVVAVLYAVSDEWHQSFVPGRSANGTDVVIDAAGAGIGLILSFARGVRSGPHSPSAGE